MAILLSVVALALAFAGGLGVVVLLGRPSSFSRTELCGAAIILGAGLVSLASFLLGILVDGAVLRAAVSVLCIGTLLLALLRNRGALSVKGPPRFVLSAALTWVFIAGAVWLLTWISLYYSDLAWDGLFNWEAKSRVALLNHGAFPLRAFRSGLSHSRYPLLVPLLGAWIYSWLGKIDQSMLKLVGPFFYLGALLMLAGSARRLTGTAWAGVLAVLILVSVPPVMLGGGSASTGYADWPLAVIYLCTLVTAHEYTRTGSAPAARLAGVMLMLGIWTKADMIVLLVCIAAVIIPRVIRERDWKFGLVILLPGLSMQLLWSIMLALTKATPDSDFGFVPHIGHVNILLRYLVIELTKWKQWSLFWPLLGLAIPLFAFRNQFGEVMVWMSGILLPMILYSFVFIFSAWSPVQAHITSSLSRLLLQVVPAAALFITLAVHRAFQAEIRKLRSTVSSPPVGAVQDRVEILISAAAEILQPIGITLDDLRELYRKKLVAKSAVEISVPRRLKSGKKSVGRPAGGTSQ